jgi:hypothetical protein
LVSRLTATMVTKPSGTPNTPAEIGLMSNQALAIEPPKKGCVRTT